MKHRYFFVGLVGAVFCLTGAARAVPIQYSFGLDCAELSRCSLGGASFFGLVTMAFTGDTASVDYSDPGRPVNVASSAHFSSGHLSATLTSASYVFAYPQGFGPFDGGVVGFTQPDACFPIVPNPRGCQELVGDPRLLDYDLATAFPLINGVNIFAPLSPQVFLTSAGELVLDFTYPYSFQALIVPEPAAWTMLVIGFGLAGVTLRRRGRHIDHAFGYRGEMA